MKITCPTAALKRFKGLCLSGSQKNVSIQSERPVHANDLCPVTVLKMVISNLGLFVMLRPCTLDLD